MYPDIVNKYTIAQYIDNNIHVSQNIENHR